MLCIAWECYAYCENLMRTAGMLFARWGVMCTVVMLCVTWERYTYRGNVMHTVGMLYIPWECYADRGNVIRTVGMLCVPWECYAYRGNMSSPMIADMMRKRSARSFKQNNDEFRLIIL
jgi:hypothetical protein